MNEALQILTERFGRDSLMSLATCSGGVPHVRTVNAYYEDGCFYIITYALSNKMQQLRQNPHVALCGDWFTAHGMGESMGWFGSEANRDLAQKLRRVFAEWIDNGHNNFADENTIILRIQLMDGVLFSHGTRYEVHF